MLPAGIKPFLTGEGRGRPRGRGFPLVSVCVPWSRDRLLAKGGVSPFDEDNNPLRTVRRPGPFSGGGRRGRGELRALPRRGGRAGGRGTDGRADRPVSGAARTLLRQAVFCSGGGSHPHRSSMRRREEINCNQLIINPV